MTLIREICKEKKDVLHLTNQDIADRANMPISTVNNYFSQASKAPSIYTAGPICAVLGVSLDRYFGIPVPDGEEVSAKDKSEVEKLQMQLEHEREKQMLLERSSRSKTRVLIALFVLFVLVLAYALVMDQLNPKIGLLHG